MEFSYEDGSQVTKFVAEDVGYKACRVDKSIERYIMDNDYIQFSLFRAFIEVMNTSRPSLMFDQLKIFLEYQDMEFGGIRHDQMHCIQDFKEDVGDTPRIMYTHLAKFTHENGNVITKRELMALYITK